MKKAELIFIPAPGVGHLVSTLEFVNRLIEQDDRISITIISIKPLFTAPVVDAYTKSLSASQPRVQIIQLPSVTPPSLDWISKSPEAYIYALIQTCIPHVTSIITEIVSSDPNRTLSLVLDFFCVSMIEVAKEFNIPSYVFFTTNAGYLGLSFYLPIRHSQIGSAFQISDPDSLIPGFRNSVPSQVLPSAVFNKDGGYDVSVTIGKWLKEAKGILVNTFEELEPYAVDFFLNNQSYPKIYPIGPMLHLKEQPNPESDPAQHQSIMKWLDDQPQSSVVFLCFGSMGSFGPRQLKEIAVGLERSGYRFLWSTRLAPNCVASLEEILPEGFAESIGERGVVCKWAHQVKILEHKAIGGFVSHCGWNSILESLWCGVPIVTWPMYAEQQLNAFRMVKELGLAMEMRLDYRRQMRGTDDEDGDVVMADEIERAVRCLMEDRDNLVRKKVKEMAEMAKKAVSHGGSSFVSTSRFIEDVIGS